MKPAKFVYTLAALVLNLAAGSAFAGPDWDTIERGRAAKKTESAKPELLAVTSAGSERESPSAPPPAGKPAPAKRGVSQRIAY